MDHIVYIRSDECDDYFKDNQAYKFKVHLKNPLILKGFWTVALEEFYCTIPSKARNEEVLYLFCNICKESIIDGELKPILRRIHSTKKSQWLHTFTTTFQLPVLKQEIYEMEFYIETTKRQLASFLSEPLMITLRFRSYPFYLDNEPF